MHAHEPLKLYGPAFVHMGSREIYGRKINADVGIERKLIHTLSL